MNRRRFAGMVLLMSGVLVLPGVASAQLAGISGAVADLTGAALPGVSVEASSPALIEGSRVVVTDGQGRYSVVSLEPGEYVVTFTLPGFSTVRREGISLSSGFTANVDVALAVGGVEETITVTGASPTVDVQNTRSQTVIDRELLDVVPSSQNIAAMAALTLGVNFRGTATGALDVGGSGGETGSASVHNNRNGDQKMYQDGMSINVGRGGGGGNLIYGYSRNSLAMQEVTMGINAMPAETETAGLQINYIPKDGGNTYSGEGMAMYTDDGFQQENFTDELRARGVISVPSLRKIWDYGASMGGPLVRDRMWFHTAHRWWGTQQIQASAFFNAVQGQKAPNGRPLFEPGSPAYINEFNQEHDGRLTMQLSQKDKLAFFFSRPRACTCSRGIRSTVAAESTINVYLGNTEHLQQYTYTRVQSNRVLIEGGFSLYVNPYEFRRLPKGYAGADFGGNEYPGVGLFDVQITEISPRFTYNSGAGLPYNKSAGKNTPDDHGKLHARASVSYVTGTHAFKGGFAMEYANNQESGTVNVAEGFGPVSYVTFQGAPIQLTQYNDPRLRIGRFRALALFAQDQWTTDRVTVNLGVRADLLNGWVPAGIVPDTVYVPGFSFDRIDDVPRWRDINPRVGVAWDVTGDGKTAVKTAFGRYVKSEATGIAKANSPASSISLRTSRTWTDTNDNFFPDGDPVNPEPNGELGRSSNPNFGKQVITRFWSPDFLTENRGGTWQFSLGVDRELLDNVSLSATYFRTSHFNQSVIDNENIGPADFEPYSVTVPAGLPNAGQVLSGFADITVDALRRGVHNVTKNAAASFGDWSEVYNGVDIELSARLDNGALLRGGVSIGQTVNDRCFAVDSPQETQWTIASTIYPCRSETDWFNSSGQIKISGSYPLPGGFAFSAVYQNLEAAEIRAEVTFFNASIAPSLGRNLSNCPAPTGPCSATRRIDVFDRYSGFEGRQSKLDIRLMRDTNIGGGRLRITVDLYNALNEAPVPGRNNRFGTTGRGYGTPSLLMLGRLLELGTHIFW